MSTWTERGRAAALALALALALAAAWPPAASAASAASAPDAVPDAARAALGRPATAAEVKAWDIDVRPDFQGLPRGSGTVSQGQAIWDGKCASCHGDFGESNEVFSPLVGGTTADDARRGRVASLTGNQPYRTTLMKVSTVSTLWDYIRRAMPWNAPRSLSPDEVYAVTAYLLSLGDIVPADFTLSERNIAAVQQKMPNRDGMTLRHGLWPGRGQPDTRNTACMRDCAATVKVVSSMPAYAHDSHGDLAAQQRAVGPTRGVGAAAGAPPAAAPAPAAGATLAGQYQCTACHAPDRKLVGPSFAEIGARYRGQDAHEALAAKIRAGGQGAWGSVPMPPQAQIPDSDLRAVVGWILEAK
ncbi:c-type cytochrome [Cupriavidus sp. 30B13]|uniref:c-type cytochrome n=1 Tax=Cupriavidus sp. 30B13 TaxID=3384241 RepID=UPI003B916811